VNSSPITFSDAWELFPCYIDNRPFSIRFDTAVENLDEEAKARYSNTLILLLHNNETDEQGFPTYIERERINKIEDNLNCDTYDIRLIGVITGGERVRFVFCYSGEAEGESLVQSLLGDDQYNVKYEYKALPGDDFAYYYDTIVPNLYERNWIMNRHVCANLEKDGEVFKTPRQIDFFCYFASEQHIQSVAEKLEQLGLQEAERTKTEQGDYLLHLIIDGVPTFDWINEITANILDTLEGTDGQFDGWGSPIQKSEE